MYPLKIKEKYNPSELEKTKHRFTTVYLWNYIRWDVREYVWSHTWVDIVPITPNQEVFSVLDWEVLNVWEDWAYWKFVNIKHSNVPDPDDFSKKIDIVSCYLHLDNVCVTQWQKLKEWDKIWFTWNTWMSYWEHLHFQIDRIEAPFHAYWPYSWEDIRAAWISFLEWVNQGLWIHNAKKYCINPLKYLDDIDSLKNNSSKEELNDTKKEEINPISNTKDTEIKIDNSPKEKIIKEELIEIKKDDFVKEEKIIKNDPLLSILNKDSEIKQPKESLWEIKKEEKIEIIKDDKPIVVNSGEKLIVSSNFDSQLNSKKQIFSDISVDDRLYDFLADLHKKWIIKWYSDNTFRPNNTITRWEFLKLLFEIKWVNLSKSTTNYFEDITDDMWQKKYINTWVELNLITTANKKFRPNDNISRIEALKVTILLYLWKYPNLNYSNSYIDVKSDDWFASIVEYAKINWIIDVSWKSFFPNASMTRWEVIYMLKKMNDLF